MADEITFIPYGAIVQTLVVGGTNIVLNFPKEDQYKSHNTQHFGCTIGRVANRLKDAKIDSLNGGKSYALAANDGKNNLHGGNVGWGRRVWAGPEPVGTREIPGVDGLEGGESVRFSLVSEDGDEGFPGEVHATVVYTTGKQKVDGKDVTVLGMEYEAELVGGADETVINMTNHSYFNLTGGPSIEGTVVTLATNTYLPVDGGSIPTGPPEPYSNIEGGKAFTLGPVEPDIDGCFINNLDSKSVPIDTRSEKLVKQTWAHHPQSGINLEVWSTEPAYQFYTGKYIEVPALPGVEERKPRSGFCVEPSRYVNAANVPEWKDQMLLKKGQKYGARIVYRAWKE